MTNETEVQPPDDPPGDIEAAKETARDRIARIDPARTWTISSPLPPWKNYGQGTCPLAFRKVRDQVEIIGAICGGGRRVPIVRLPDDCRPPGWTIHSVAVVGVDGIATAIVDAAGRVTISTDHWSGGQSHYDLGLICFPVSEQLAQLFETESRTARRPAKTENRNGVIVTVTS